MSILRNDRCDVNPGASARCQYSNIWQQAMEGSRVFDIRCFLRKTRDHQEDEDANDGPLFQGGAGRILGRVRGYADVGPGGCRDVCQPLPDGVPHFPDRPYKMHRERGRSLGAVPNADTHKMTFASVIHRRATGNLADLEVNQLRGKLLLVFDKEFMGQANPGSRSAGRVRIRPNRGLLHGSACDS